MTEHKFTDEKIIKALECCVEGTSEACLKCAFGINPPYPVCKTMVEKHALALINRQKAEIERLSKLLDDKCDRCIAKDRAETAKEFADKLIRKVVSTHKSRVFIEVCDVVTYTKQIEADLTGACGKEKKT